MEQVVIKIYDTASSHLVMEQFTQQGSPVLRWNGFDENFQAIMTSEFNFNMLSENAEDGKFFDLFTGDESKFRVVIETGTDSTIWAGYLLPDQYSEPYKNGAFFVNFTATDGLGLLKNKPFTFFDFDEEVSVVYMIATILKQTNLYQYLYIAEAFNMVNSNWNDVLLNTANFRGETILTGPFGAQDETEYDSCYDVLEKLLYAIGCTLYSYWNRWYIVGWNRKHLITDTFKVYDFHGIFDSSKTMVKEVVPGLFNDGLLVYMNSPLRRVDVSCDLEEEEEIISEKFYYKDTGEGGINPVPTPGLYDNSSPLEYWEALSGIQMSLGNATAERILEGTNPVIMYESKPWCLKLNLDADTPVNANRYIHLKRDYQKFVEFNEYSKILLDLEVELFSLPSVNVKDKTEAGYFNESFRIDILIGENLVFTTRPDSAVFLEPVFEVKYEDEVNPSVVPGALNNKRKRKQRRVVAKLKTTVESDYEGLLDIRIYQPKFLAGQSIDWSDIHVSKLDVAVKTNPKRKVYNLRKIKYSTSKEIDSPFYSSKSDLTKKGFRRPLEVKYWNGQKQNVPLSNRLETDTQISYQLSASDAVWLRKNLASAEIEKWGEKHYLKNVFGAFNILEGFYIDDSLPIPRIYFSKVRIQELFYLWNPFDGFTISVYKTEVSSMPWQGADRTRWMKFKRFGSQIELDYGKCYGRMMLDCQASPYVRLDGFLKKIISPLDLVRFEWVGERIFWVSRLDLDFSTGNSKVLLCETKFETINDDIII